MEFVYFLGRFHVLVLHVPIGVLTLAIVFECLVRRPPFRFLTPIVAWTWLAGGIAAVGTVALGLMHANESAFIDNPAVEAHRTAALTLTVLAFLVWLLRLRPEPTHASDWPAWARRAKLDAAYAKVQPLWGKDGKLDKFYDKTGWIIACVLTFVMMSVTGHLGGNLTHGETFLVQYAPRPIRRLMHLPDPPPPPKAAPAQTAPSGGAGSAGAYDENANLPKVPRADAAVMAALESNGFIVRPVANNETLLDVDYTLPRPIADADLASLAKIGPQILRLNLHRAGLGDAQLKRVGQLPNLRRLRLEGNPLSDAGMTQLLGLKSLRYLNIAGTKVADGGLMALGGLPNLHEVYVWQSAATHAGIKAFRAAHPKVVVDAGLKPADIVKETRVLKPR